MLERLQNDCIRRKPFIWVRRLAVLERCEPEPVFVRDIPLSRGLNILWAEEPEEDEVSTPIAGHSAGKTTFCRFYRYILGETTYANQKNAKLIRAAFENGYVAAELYIDGRLWAVRRPIGSGRLSYIAPDVTIEQLLRDGGRSVPQDKYTERIGIEALMDRFEAGDVARSGEPIQWGHILAWMTRDQEARFQSVHDWRSPRSGSQTPSFRYPKSGALFVMRAALGLFRPEELNGEERLTALYTERDELEKDIDEKRREPQYRANLRISQLRQALTVEFPDDHSIASVPVHTGDMLPDLLTRAHDAVMLLEDRAAELARKEQTTQQSVDEKTAKLAALETERDKLKAGIEQAKGLADQADSGQSERRQLRESIEKNRDVPCEFAWIAIGECTHVQYRLRTLDRSAGHDEHTLEQIQAQAEEQCRYLQRKLQDIEPRIVSLQSELPGLRQQRADHRDARIEADQCRKYIEGLRESLEKWIADPVSPEEFQELRDAEKALADKQAEIEQQEQRLAELIQEHQVNRDLLAEIFSMCVRAVISAPGYDGKVDFDNRELQFHLVHGTAMSGEAVETLAILLADVTAVLFNCLSPDANLPGFLLHDSPREADLGLRLYRAFINFIAELETTFGGADECPFQYILTTTSPPPKALREPPTRKDRFSAQSENDLFLRRDISAVSYSPDAEGDLFEESAP